MEQSIAFAGDRPFSLALTSRTRPPSTPQVRNVMRWALVSAVIYSLMVIGSRGSCAGSIGAGGGASEVLGQTAGATPMCTFLELGPSPLVYLFLALLALWATQPTEKPFRRVRNLRRACLATGVGCALLAQTSFLLVDLNPGGPVPTVPFGVVTMSVTPAGY